MIKTFDDLFEKLKKDGRCTSVPEERLKNVQEKMPGKYGKEKSERSVNWLIGYLFCLADEGYISDDESARLQDIVLDMRYE